MRAEARGLSGITHRAVLPLDALRGCDEQFWHPFASRFFLWMDDGEIKPLLDLANRDELHHLHVRRGCSGATESRSAG